LLFFTYGGFFLQNLNWILTKLGGAPSEATFSILLPVGISFYTFQALGYTVDVYRGDVEAEKSFVRYALFVSFFPQLVAGPIERSKNLLHQLKTPHPLTWLRLKRGFLLMLWGFFQKLVIADRVALLVNTVYGSWAQQPGSALLLATAFFAVQIYCDFAAYSNIATGAARMLGIDLMQNFRQPYLATGVADFWRRWHISLSTWFRDYLYIPLGGNRKGTARKYFNIAVVFLASGLWHGASWTFVVWGALHALYQILEDVFLRPNHQAQPQKSFLPIRIVQTAVTFCFINIAWVFFRAATVSDGFAIIKKIFSDMSFAPLKAGGVYNLGLVKIEFIIAVAAIIVLFFVDLLRECDFAVGYFAATAPLLIQWVLGFSVLFAILIFGMYSVGYTPSQFIYFQF
ncbi:MAG: MBOAT family protein, partial [Oscillospiraceae bacterium]|nr:MBOAT family protein [Oscillospiraceae bacterium]